MLTRRDALARLAAISGGSMLHLGAVLPDTAPRRWWSDLQQGDPALAPGAPMSPERRALIDAFRKSSDGVERRFDARQFVSDWTMPYRLFRPKAPGLLPLVVYLHGSGGLGTDNEGQMKLGNIFGTRLFALPANQERFPCYVVAPQTDRGWINYGPPAPGQNTATPAAGLGDGARAALALIDALIGEFPIDPRRVYVTGQSMGGAGVWHMTAERPHFFAGAVAICGSRSLDDPAASARTALWNFHGDADQTVPITESRGRVAAVRKAGGRPIATEYAGVDHNSWEWAFTEPSLLPWLFAQRRGG